MEMTERPIWPYFKYLTAAVIATSALAVVIWLLMIFFDEQLLWLLGSEGELLETGLEYLKPLKAAIPVFVFGQMLAAFLCNDSDPGRATFAVVFTSVLNVAGTFCSPSPLTWACTARHWPRR